jgi:predicted small metal-binding protein
MKLKGTINPIRLRRLSKKAAAEARRQEAAREAKEATMTEKEKGEARAKELEEYEKQRLKSCIAQIPLMLERAARAGHNCAYVFSSARNREEIAPAVLEHCKTLKGLTAKYETESVQPLGFVDEFTPNDTIYHVVVVW